MSMKIPLTPGGIEPATFQIVAQHLNHCATAVPVFAMCNLEFTIGKATCLCRVSLSVDNDGP